MSMGDKIKNAAEETVGKIKEATGKVTGNDELEARGPDRPGRRQRQADRREGQGHRQGRLRQLNHPYRHRAHLGLPWRRRQRESGRRRLRSDSGHSVDPPVHWVLHRFRAGQPVYARKEP